MSNDNSPIILAFSGGLDTSFCVPWLRETYGRDVITATIDTGGIDPRRQTRCRNERQHLARSSTSLSTANLFSLIPSFDISSPATYYAVKPTLCVSAQNAACKPNTWRDSLPNEVRPL